MISTVRLTALFLATLSVATAADEKAAPSIAGEYTLVSGKKFGMDPDAEAKKAKYTIDAKQITIDGQAKFVIGYTLNAKLKPVGIDMTILDGPEGTKGEKALGIVEKNGDELKLAYSLEKDKRAKDFEGKDGMLFVFKLKGK